MRDCQVRRAASHKVALVFNIVMDPDHCPKTVGIIVACANGDVVRCLSANDCLVSGHQHIVWV